MVKQEKARSAAGKYQPKFFSAHQYAVLGPLCDAIIPPDEHSGGAVQAGAPDFIDLLSSENKDYQTTLGGGLMWLDAFCLDHYENPYLTCTVTQRKEVLDLIAYRKNAETDPGMSQGIAFFAFLRRLTTDAFYSSEIGVKDLHYSGNTFVTNFPGCPPVPET